MNQVGHLTTDDLPDLIRETGSSAQTAVLDFFLNHRSNTNTRKSYGRAIVNFMTWCKATSLLTLDDVKPFHVSVYLQDLGDSHSAPTVKQHLAAIRAMFDWLAIKQIVPLNPAAAVRGPKFSAKRGKTPVLEPAEARQLLDSIEDDTPIGLRDRALISLMVYSFARVSAAVGMKVGDVFYQNKRLWVRLHEKGGKRHELPCHHNLAAALHAYLERSGVSSNPTTPLFPTIGRGTGRLTQSVLPRNNAYHMVVRRAAAAGILAKVGNHTFRATGITTYLKNGGTLERAAQMASHSSTRTTQLYDQRNDDLNLDEVERILI
jgi:site-specific recombinase XerD